MQLESRDPTTGELIRRYEPQGQAEVEQRIAGSFDAWGGWATRPIEARVELLRATADLLDERTETYAQLITQEMGKPLAEARAEIGKCALGCRHYADAGPGYLEPDVVPTEASASYVRFDPLGPLLAVMPWNFPFWQVIRFAAPALLAGNAVLLKHAENSTGCSLEIERLLTDAGAPSGLLQSLLIERGQVADILADDRVRGVTVTGSVGAGRAVAGIAGRYGKPAVLELGGSDPFVVLEDADVAQAAQVAAKARLMNAGQSCISPKRFIVVDAVREEFTQALVEAMRSTVVGDPRDEATDIGPLARGDLRDTLQAQVEATRQQGAVVALDGGVVDGPGYFYAPQVLTEVRPDYAAACEETFGPVATVINASDADEAVAIANGTPYGLGACVWTQDVKRGERIAGGLEAGAVFINDMVRSDPRMPFGGVKDSGYGRELGGLGARAFTNAKSVWAS